MLRQLFGHLLVPAEVAREVAPSLGALPSWADIVYLYDIPTFSRNPGAGESAAIALAMTMSIDSLVLDDQPARTVALELGLPVIGSLGLLVTAKQRGLLAEVRPLMDAMIANQFYVAGAVYRRILSLAEEDD
jgi:predicted nucleic acid-binding protein